MAASGRVQGSYGWLLQPSFPLGSEALVNSHHKAGKLLAKVSPVMGLRHIPNDPFTATVKELVLL